MKVLLVGCGRVGGEIAESLVKKQYVKTLFLYSRTIKSSKALAYDLKNGKVKVVSHIEDVNNPDYVIIALSNQSEAARRESFHTRGNTYHVRQDELIFNLGAITQLSKSLKKICKDTKIIVVTNPVDEFTNYLRIIMNYNNIFGFGLSLDALRYSKLLKRKVLCIGSHGKAIPLLDLKTKKNYEKLHNEIDGGVIKYLRKRGMTHKITGDEFSNFFDKLNSPKETNILVASYLLKDPFLGVKGIAISIPFHVKKGKIISPADVNVSSLERELFLKQVKELKQSVEHILWIHERLISYQSNLDNP